MFDSSMGVKIIIAGETLQGKQSHIQVLQSNIKKNAAKFGMYYNTNERTG